MRSNLSKANALTEAILNNAADQIQRDTGGSQFYMEPATVKAEYQNWISDSDPLQHLWLNTSGHQTLDVRTSFQITTRAFY